MSRNQRIIFFLAAVGCAAALYFVLDRNGSVLPPERKISENVDADIKPKEAKTKKRASQPASSPSAPTKALTEKAAASTPPPPGRAPRAVTSAETEAAIMDKLRALEFNDLGQSLALAREGNERFPDTPDASERAWYVVRCLSRMGRFDEAEKEAKLMVERYPDTSWTHDVNRHVLLHP